MTIRSHLSNLFEPMPEWLKNYQPGDGVNIENFFCNRTVYYPGAGFDGQPVELFASTHFAHAFVYVDYGMDRSAVEAELNHPNYGFKGYRLLDRVTISENGLTPNGWTPHLTREEVGENPYWFARIRPYVFLQIMERSVDYDENHGPFRIAIMFVGGDGIASYDAIFCQNHRKPPIAIVIQDHGYGANYARFDDDSLFHRLALRTKQCPQYLLVADNSKEWEGYVCAVDNGVVYGGCHGTPRRLFKKQG